MRKLPCISALVAGVCIALILPAFAKDEALSLFLNGTKVTLNPGVIARDGVVYMPLISGCKALGGTAKKNVKTDKWVITVNNKRTSVTPSECITLKSTVYAPLKPIADALDIGMKVDARAKAVRLTEEAPAPSGGG